MGYQWGKSPLGAAGWKARALAAEDRATKYAAEIMAADSALGDARTQCNAARRELEQVRRGSLQAVGVMAGRAERLRDRSERNAARVRMLAADLREAREALDDVGRVRQQWRTVAELRWRLDARAARVRALAFRAREFRAEARMLREQLAQEREANRINVRQLEHALANAQTRTTEALQDAKKAHVRADAAERGAQEMRGIIHRTADTLNEARKQAERRRARLQLRADRFNALAAVLKQSMGEMEREQARADQWAAEVQKWRAEAEREPVPPAAVGFSLPVPYGRSVAAWENRVRDLEGALRDQQHSTEVWKREANDAARAVTTLRNALTTARFNATHTRAEANRALEETEGMSRRERNEA